MAVRVGRATEVWLASQGATTNIDVNVGFTPTAGKYAVFAFMSGASASTDTTGAHLLNVSWGFATSASSRRSTCGYSALGSSSSSCGKACRNDAILSACDAGTINALLDFGGEITNGVRFTVDDQALADYRFNVIVIDGLTSAGISDVLSPAATGNFNHTLPIADPELLIFLSAGPFTAFPYFATSLQMSLGAAHADGQFATGIVSRTAQPTMSTFHYSNHNECAVSVGTTGLGVERLSWVSTSGTTLTLNCLERQGTSNIHCCLSMKGIEATVQNGLTQTDTTTAIPITGLASTCLGGLIVSTCEAESTQDTPTAHNHLSIGSFIATDNRGSHGIWDENGTANSEPATSVDYDAVYTNISSGDAQVGTMDVQSMDSGGATFIMDDADPAQTWFGAILFADVAAAPSRTKLNTRSYPLGTEIGMGWRLNL